MLPPLQVGKYSLDWKDCPYLMGIINVTPDSFSDGGEALTVKQALEKAEALLAEGALILDIGGESTRPFAKPVPEDEEIKRVIPVIKAIREHFPEAIISIDTYKAKVAELALSKGADMVNDISGAQYEPKIVDVLKDFNCPYVLMHIKGTPQDMQINPHYDNLLEEMKNYFKERIDWLTTKGVSFEKIIIDPGIGFGKTFQHNITILKNLKEFKEFNRPLLLGPSRKAFIGEIIQKPPKERDAGTVGVALFSYLQGVHFLRVHRVSLVKDALETFKYLLGNRELGC
ncbi:MAG: dihydropteroate synthase [Caldimicrobium sp.]|nr:dihydropteroate synthase [Caldimicrobium sp.]MCX7872837.1 dihydropteroate synthase [Caldimicrobium sp.]MDW8093584.1 dihydropteroate synthase [Caldimicrobium sp.]